VAIDGEPIGSPPLTDRDLPRAFRANNLRLVAGICADIATHPKNNSQSMLRKALISILRRCATLPPKDRQAYYTAAAPLGKAFVECVRGRPELFRWVPTYGITSTPMYHAVRSLVCLSGDWAAFLGGDGGIARLRIFTRHMTPPERRQFSGLAEHLGCTRVIDGGPGSENPATVRWALLVFRRTPLPPRFLAGFLLGPISKDDKVLLE